MDKKKKNTAKHYGVWLAILAILILIFYLAGSGIDAKEISYNEAYTYINDGTIQNVYAEGGKAYLLKVDSEIDKKDFPDVADYYFEFTSWSQLDFINEYNVGKDLDQQVTVVYKYPAESFIETIAPYVSVVIMIVIGVLIYKMFSNKGNGVGAFNKSKARLVEKSNIRFANIAGADEEKEEVQEIVEFLKNPNKFKALGARIPKGILLVGPPGTGKTLLAKAVAGESNVPFLSITGSDFVELYVGVGAGRVRDLFETAKRNAPCIVFIDEIDAVGRQRGAGLGGGNDEREQTLNQLLVEMDGFEANEGVIVLAATNRADVLDPALLRPGRFDRQIYVNIPDVRGREGILKIHAKNKPIDPSVDFKDIARLTSGFTGADIENVLNEAAILSARNGKTTIGMTEITEGINKVLMGPQKKSRLVTEKDKKLTAYHEAGHAIIAKKLDCGENVHEVSIIPRGMAGGYTSTRPSDDDEHYSLSKLNNRISMMMGGRIAEKIEFDDITAGASSDISKATEIARKMVTEWGMSEKLGFLSFGSKNEVFIGRDYQTQNNYSEATASIIDSEIKRIVDENYERAYKILSENKSVLDNLANLLLEKETIYTKEVDEIMAGVDYKEVVKRIDKDEKNRKKQEDKKKREQEEANALRIQQLKEQAAEALNSAGVISKNEYNKIKEQGQKLRDQLDTKVETKAKSKTKPSDDTEKASHIEENNDVNVKSKGAVRTKKSNSDTSVETKADSPNKTGSENKAEIKEKVKENKEDKADDQK